MTESEIEVALSELQTLTRNQVGIIVRTLLEKIALQARDIERATNLAKEANEISKRLKAERDFLLGEPIHTGGVSDRRH